MKSLISKQVERFLREQKNYKRWLAVFLCLAVVVTLGTTAALKYKGIAVTGDADAAQEMHMEQTGEAQTVVSEEVPEGMRRMQGLTQAALKVPEIRGRQIHHRGITTAIPAMR